MIQFSQFSYCHEIILIYGLSYLVTNFKGTHSCIKWYLLLNKFTIFPMNINSLSYAIKEG